MSNLEPTLGRGPSQDVFLGGEQAALHLVELLAHEDKQVRERALFRLGEIGDDRAARGLLAILDNRQNHPKRRARAAHALGYIHTEQVFQSLLRRIREPYWYVRWQITLALGRSGDQRAVEPLLTILNEDLSSFARQNAALALGELRSTAAIASLIAALDDNRAIVREAAADALVAIGTPEAHSAVHSYKEQQGVYD